LTEYGYATTFSGEVFIIARHPVPAKTNPRGIKGCGETGCAGALVMNAIVDALSPCGIGRIDMQATPEQVWQAIRRAPSAPAL
jgi:aerobic carbon-monoxide dehydrogenase large subunit